MKISKKRLNRLIDERVERRLEQYRKTEQELRKQLDEVHALMDDFTVRSRPSSHARRFEEYDD